MWSGPHSLQVLHGICILENHIGTIWVQSHWLALVLHWWQLPWLPKVAVLHCWSCAWGIPLVTKQKALLSYQLLLAASGLLLSCVDPPCQCRCIPRAGPVVGTPWFAGTKQVSKQCWKEVSCIEKAPCGCIHNNILLRPLFQLYLLVRMRQIQLGKFLASIEWCKHFWIHFCLNNFVDCQFVMSAYRIVQGKHPPLDFDSSVVF